MHDASSVRVGTHDRQWPAAAVLALIIEAALVAGALWWARPGALPPASPVVQIVLQAPPAHRTVVLPQPHPAPPRPAEKPRPHPVVPRPIHRARPKPLTPLPPPPRPAAQRKPSPAPITEDQPVVPISPPAAVTASIRANFEAALRSAIQAAVRYPAAARLMELSGSTVVAFGYRDGRVSAVRIARSCGIAMLDRAAVQAVRNAPYPVTPVVLRGRRMEFDIHVRFRLNAP